jgi:alpha-ribazole phosphatase/probable phosphoglycerate mutase
MKIYLIRHGQTDWNIAGKIQGTHDIPLNETGRGQALKLAEAMDTRPVAKIFSSPLKRAANTAAMIGERQSTEICSMKQLVEVEFGKWEGLTWAEIQKEYPEEFKGWTDKPEMVSPPGGEALEHIQGRCIGAWNEIRKITAGLEDVAIVSHGATLKHLFSFMMGYDTKKDPGIVENASITTLEFNPVTEEFLLLERNESSHLK